MSQLSEKYRPNRFADFWQGLDDPTIKVVTSELEKNRISSPTLLTGPYGSAKTSVARTIGLRACCENPQDHPFEPCLNCPTCQHIRKRATELPIIFSSYGYLEIDCTIKPVEWVLEIIRDHSLQPRLWASNSQFTGWVITLDEFGRYGEAQQRKLLKTLETSRATLILCCATQDVVDQAILDRCVVRPLNFPTTAQCVTAVERIVAQEGSIISSDAARLLANRLGNNPRSMMNTLSDALQISNGSIKIETIEAALQLRQSR